MPVLCGAVSWGLQASLGGRSSCGAGRGWPAGPPSCWAHPAVTVLAFQGDRAEQADQLLQEKRERVLQILEGNFPSPCPQYLAVRTVVTSVSDEKNAVVGNFTYERENIIRCF